jgi:hypothetical protein
MSRIVIQGRLLWISPMSSTVHAGSGLIEEQRKRIGHKRPRDLKPPAICVGETLRGVISPRP